MVNSDTARGRHWARWLGITVATASVSLTAPSCLYDDSKVCGDDLEVYGDNERCICPEGSVYTPDGCITCGEHQIVQGTQCVCEEGYEPTGPGGACEEVPPSTGGAGGDGGSGDGSCATSDDCDGDAECNNAGLCVSPPSGLLQSCAGPEDCAGNDADFCDTFVQMACLVQNCTVTPNDCSAGFDCCDLSAFGLPTLCIPEGECMQ